MKKIKNKYLILSFIIPLVICLLVAYCKTFIYGGVKNVLVSDMQGQYVSLFSYLQDVIKGQESLLYSFSKGLGGNMIGTFAYYLASPLNLILIFFSKVHITWGILTLIMLKISLSGLTMYLYLSNTFNKDKLMTLLFSTCYAFIAYNVNYYFNIMWLDGVYLAPLILLGIDRIIKKKSSLLYGIALFFAVLSNYYIGYMLCLFSCVYFAYKIILTYNLKKDKDDLIEVIIKFGITSVLAGLMTFVLLVPAIIELQNSQRAFGNLTSNNFAISFNILDILSRTFISSHNNANIISRETISIYSGLIILPLVFFYFLNNKFKLKEKIINGSMILFFMLSIFIPHLNFIWHGMNFPNGFNYRFSFLFSLFLIMIACKSFWEIKRIPLKAYLFFFIGYTLTALTMFFMNYPYLSTANIYISIACLGLYLIILYNYDKEKDEKKNNLVKYLLLLMVFSELFFNFFLSIRDYEVGYQNEFAGYMTKIQAKVDQYKPSDTEFYRMEKNLNYTYLDSMLLNYNSVTAFLSTMNAKSTNFFNNIGAAVFEISVDYQNGNTYMMDSLLGLKYYMSNYKEMPEHNLIDKFKFSKYARLMYGMEDSDVKIYENSDALSLGYMVNDKVKNFTEIFVEGKKYTNFDFQNTIMQTMVDSNKDYLKPYNVEKVGKYEYVIDVTNDENFYFMVPFNNRESEKAFMEIYIDGKFAKRYNRDDFGIFLIENVFDKQKVNVSFKPSDDGIDLAYPTAYYLDYDALKEDLNVLKQHQLIIDKQDKNHVKGHINVSEDKRVLFTSIPYENGWNIKVDNKEVDYYKVFDAFVAIDLEPGDHDIEFTFYPPGLNLGILISIISILLFSLYMWKEKQFLNLIKKTYKKYEEIVNYLIVGGLTTVVNFIVYVLFAKLIGFDYIVSSIFAWILAVLFAYFANKIIVFKSKNSNLKNFLNEMYQFFKYRVLSLGVDLGLMFLMVDVIFIDDVVAKLLVQFVIIVINYIFSKLFIFKSK